MRVFADDIFPEKKLEFLDEAIARELKLESLMATVQADRGIPDVLLDGPLDPSKIKERQIMLFAVRECLLREMTGKDRMNYLTKNMKTEKNFIRPGESWIKTMETLELKRKLILLIGDCIDEESIPGCNSFVEMDQAVIHYAGDGGDRYFRVTLTQTTEDEYFTSYDPGRVL